MSDLSDIAKTINDLLHDIKAEVVIADLIENGVNPLDIIYSPVSSFNRNYKHDITKAEIRRLNNYQNLLFINISRDGIYDSLPEGLFHDSSPERITSGKDMARDSKKLKLEEKDIRNFFLPFENEIFTQLVNIEVEERKLISQYSDALFSNIFPDFWKIDRSLPRKWVSRMVLFLHFAHQYITDYETVAKCLEVIIEENVRIIIIPNRNFTHSPDERTLQSSSFELGKASLGDDTIVGIEDVSMDLSFEYIIGPVKNTPLDDFLENGQMTKFLKCFFGFFTPVETEVTTTILIDRSEEGFILTDMGIGTALGYNTIL